MQAPRRAPTDQSTLVGSADVIESILRWWARVQQDPTFQDRRGPTMLRILAAFAMFAVTAGKVHLEASYRQLAEWSGLSLGTISKHESRWLPWVRAVRKGSRYTRAPSVWRLRIEHACNIDPVAKGAADRCRAVRPGRRHP